MPIELVALANIGLAALLSLVVGAEREYFVKAAGMRTHTLVGTGAALFTVVSKYGFADIGGNVDGARVAAQVVTGIGFLGAGLIFVRRDTVRGLTTAASIWCVAAIGMAAGAGMSAVAAGAAALYLFVTLALRPISARMPHAASALGSITLTYDDGKGVLRTVMETIGDHGVQVADLQVLGTSADAVQEVRLELTGPGRSIIELVHDLAELAGVRSVTTPDELAD